ncbi:hypothetical protein HDU67_010256 [Dinochytrium kinnereticum]|nr:hypothetical protein HDU67_010256 [Dinochytrium kinnereticum]
MNHNPHPPPPRKRGRPRLADAAAASTASHSPNTLDLDAVRPPFLPEDYDLADRKDRHFGLRTAPTFRPSPQEWTDPLSYIEKIRLVGERTGIVKIIPPEGWKPDFAMDTEKFRFSTRIQKLNSMEGSTRTVVNYLDQLEQFHQQHGSSFTRVPMLDRKPLDLHQLKKEVASRGGYEEVTRMKKWSEVGRVLGADKQCTSGSYICRNAYLRWIRPFEEYLASMGSEDAEPAPFFDQNAATEEPTTPKKISSAPKSRMSMSPSKKSSETSLGSPKESLSSRVTSDAQPKKRGRPPKNKEQVQDIVKVTSSSEFDGCELCGSMKNEDRILLCDSCDRGFHLDCLVPPLAAVPQTDEWFCPDCLRSYGNDYGFEDGGDYTLAEFHRFAADFKEKWFSGKDMYGADGKLTVTEDDVEKEFWRLVESPYDEIEVEYGADLHSTQHGSGFPVAEKQPLNPYATCGWNLNNIPVLSDSLFCHIRNDISGIMIPWLYVGMVFSTFCWHTEDHYTYSINYLHWGETKTWYGVPASHAERFEDAMRSKVPELFQATPDLLFHLTTMLSPGVLNQNMVDVFALDQRAGEFVITFPKAYHAGFNHGFNFAEAVNFALPNWLPYGFSCIERYREFHKQPVFSHDELIIATLRKDSSIRTAMWLQEELNLLEQRERVGREIVRKAHPGIKEVVEDCHLSMEDEDLLCAVCRTFCYGSRVFCECGKTRPVCLQHSDAISDICSCEEKKFVLWMRFSESQLAEMTLASRRIANRPLEWKERYRLLMLSYRRPPLREMQKLLAIADKIPCFIDEAITLRAFVDRACEWVTKASKMISLVYPKRSRNQDNDEDSEWTIDESVSMEILEQLISEVDDLPFDCPEIPTLRNLVEDWRMKRAQAVDLLAESLSPLSRDAIQEYLNAFAESLGSRESQNWKLPYIKELNLLVGAQKDLEWISRAESIISSFAELREKVVIRTGDKALVPQFDMDILDGIIRDGRRPNVAAAGENDYIVLGNIRRRRAQCLTELKRYRDHGDRWKLEVIALYKQKTIDFKELRQLYTNGLKLYAEKETFAKAARHVQIVDSWVSRVTPLLKGILVTSGSDTEMDLDDPSSETHESKLPARPDPSLSNDHDVKKLTVPDVQRLVDELDAELDAPLFVDEKDQIEKSIKKVEEWAVRGRKIFGFSGRATQSLMAILEENVWQAKICAGIEIPPVALHCICRSSSEEGMMIECDSCNVWYHTQCVRVTKKEARSQTRYLCLVCDPTYSLNSIPVQKRAHLNHIASFLEDVSDLPLIPDELGALETLVSVLTRWRNHLRKTIASLEESGPAIVTRDDVKGLLRCLEGYAVCIEDGVVEKLRTLLWLHFPCNAAKAEGGEPSDSSVTMEEIEDEDAHDGTYAKDKISSVPARPSTSLKQEVFCLCRSKYDSNRPMIACDTCEDWFHFSCVNLSAQKAESLSSYKCPVCDGSRKVSRDSSMTDVDQERSAQEVRAESGLPKITLKLPKLDASANKRKESPVSGQAVRKRSRRPSTRATDEEAPTQPVATGPTTINYPAIPMDSTQSQSVFRQPYQYHAPLSTPESALEAKGGATAWPSPIYGTWIVVKPPSSTEPLAAGGNLETPFPQYNHVSERDMGVGVLHAPFDYLSQFRGAQQQPLSHP